MTSLLGNVANKVTSGRSVDKGRPPMIPRGVMDFWTGRQNADSQLSALTYSSTLYQAVRTRGTSLGEVKWCLYQKSDGRGRLSGVDTRREITDHPALRLLDQPNPFMSKSFFLETISMHLDCTGKAYVYNMVADSPMFEATARQPLELWPLPPQWTRPVPGDVDFLHGYIFEGPSGQRIPYTTDQVYWFRIPHPTDPYDGLGPVQPLLQVLWSDRLAKVWNGAFFQNSAEPGGVIEAPDGLTKEEWDLLHEDWEAAHKGVANSSRVAVLSRAKWVPTNPTMRDMQFQELLSQSREMILEGTRVSKTLLGQTEDVNRATAEAAQNVFAKYTMRESLNRIREWLNKAVLPRFPGGDRYEFDFEDPVTEDYEAVVADRDSRIGAVTALISAGFDPQKTMQEFGFPDIPFEKPKPVQPSVPGSDMTNPEQDGEEEPEIDEG